MRWRHLILSTTLASLTLAVLGAPVALAGGWAVTTLDTLPNELRAGEMYPIGYTIRQHGQTPLITAESGIEIRAQQGGPVEWFAGTPEGPRGHYVAQVRFAESGEWEWTAVQTPFQPQPLGSISIMPARALMPQTAESAAAEPAPTAMTAVSSPARAATWPWPVRLGLIVAAVLSLALFACRLAVSVLPARPAVARRSPLLLSTTDKFAAKVQ